MFDMEISKIEMGIKKAMLIEIVFGRFQAYESTKFVRSFAQIALQFRDVYNLTQKWLEENDPEKRIKIMKDVCSRIEEHAKKLRD